MITEYVLPKEDAELTLLLGKLLDITEDDGLDRPEDEDFLWEVDTERATSNFTDTFTKEQAARLREIDERNS